MVDVFGENYPDKLLNMCVSYSMNNLSILTFAHSSDKDEYEEDDKDTVSLRPGKCFYYAIIENANIQ